MEGDEKEWRRRKIFIPQKRALLGVVSFLVLYSLIKKARTTWQNQQENRANFRRKVETKKDELDGMELGLLGSIFGSLVVVALRVFLPRKTVVFQLNKQSRHLRYSADRSISELNYNTAERTLKTVQSLLVRRPKLFGVVDHHDVSVQETLGYLAGKKGNFREALSIFRHAMALRPSLLHLSAGWRFANRAGLVQNHIMSGLCYRGLDHHDAADEEFNAAYLTLWGLSFSLNILSPKRWKYLIEMENELKLHSALTLHPLDVKYDLQNYLESIDIICNCDDRLKRLRERIEQITDKADETTIEQAVEILIPYINSSSSQSIDFNNYNSDFRLILKLFGLGNIYSAIALQRFNYSDYKEKEDILYKALFIYTVAYSSFTYLKKHYQPPKVSYLLDPLKNYYKQRFWPPSLLEANRNVTKEILGHQIVSVIVRMSIIRLELHDLIASPKKAIDQATLAYQELEFANKILNNNLHDKDLFLQGRVMFYLGASAKRIYNFDEARHAFNAAAASIEAIPRTEDKAKVDAFLGTIKKFSGLMHLVFGEFKEAECCFNKAHKIYFGATDVKKQREYAKILDCQGQLMYMTGEYVQALLCHESAARYEILYRSLSQQNLAYQLQVLNVLKPSKALKKIIMFIENRFNHKMEQVDKQIKEAKNEMTLKSLESYKLILSNIESLLVDLKQNIFQFHPSGSAGSYVEVFYLLMSKLNDAEALDLKSVPLLIQIAQGFSLVADFERGEELVKVIFDIISKTNHRGVERAELLIDYLIATARININSGLLASSYQRLELASSLMWSMYHSGAKYRTVLIDYLLSRARLVLLHHLLRSAIIMEVGKLQEFPRTSWEEKVLDTLFLGKGGPDIDEAWENLTTAQHYQKIAYSKDSYETALCNELLGKYFLQTKQFDKSKEYFSTALHSTKSKLGTDHPSSIKLQHFINISTLMEQQRVGNPLAPSGKSLLSPDFSGIISSIQNKGILAFDFSEILVLYASHCQMIGDVEGLQAFSAEIRRKFSEIRVPGHPFGLVGARLEGREFGDLLESFIHRDACELEKTSPEINVMKELTTL